MFDRTAEQNLRNGLANALRATNGILSLKNWYHRCPEKPPVIFQPV